MKQKISDEEFTKIVSESYSIAEVIRKMGRIPAGGNYAVVHQRIKTLGLDTSHFTGQAWNKGKQLDDKYHHYKSELKDILVKDSYYQSYQLAKRLIKAGLKTKICECCGNTIWQNQEIPLELHHINGDHNDNRIENLQLLCPNCHALTDTYCRKKSKVKSAQEETLDVEVG